MRLPLLGDSTDTAATDRGRATDRDRADERTTRAERRRRRSARVVEGAKGGLVATLVMTAYRLPISHALPPTAVFWSKFVAGGDPNDHPVAAIVLHLLYGLGAGVAFGALVPTGSGSTASTPQLSSSAAEADEDDREARREAAGLLAGTVYGLVLSVFGERVVLERVLGMSLDADDRLVFHVGHAIYGLTLGTWMGSRVDDR
ncbi:hypothetical protein NGM07_15500 [Halorussus vallis]|uniref:hypothetical protein n=1 Tax=Halorussus vallis TaxID=2953749 RepID=UPI00209CECAC|nr:hypothetical protein [Halorussus vallis]USZ74835.1 hypothetical protein NGM07_15500 [Halorussus vallis]